MRVVSVIAFCTTLVEAALDSYYNAFLAINNKRVDDLDGYDPWEGTHSDDGLDRTEWYTPYEQYTRPKRAYVPFPAPKSVYAICNFSNELSTLELAQIPGKAITVRYN